MEMLSLPRELLPRIIADLDCAVTLLATCHQLREQIPPDLFAFTKLESGEHIIASEYYEDSIHRRFNWGFPSSYSCRRKCMVNNWVLSPGRLAYLRVFTAGKLTFYLQSRDFAPNPAGILPVYDKDRKCRPAEAILSLDLFRLDIETVFTGSVDELTTLAAAFSVRSRLFIRVSGVQELFERI